jgi:type III secretion protein Y
MERVDHAARLQQSVQLLHAIGYIYGCHGQTKRALVLLLIAVRLAPQDAGVLRTLAHTFLIDGSPHQSVAVIERLESMEGPSNPVLDLLKSRALWAAGRQIEARRCFRDFLERRTPF